MKYLIILILLLSLCGCESDAMGRVYNKDIGEGGDIEITQNGETRHFIFLRVDKQDIEALLTGQEYMLGVVKKCE